MYSIGIDSGSTTTKGILYNGDIVKKIIMKTSVKPRESILSTYKELSSGIKEKPYLVVTGYGRELADFADKRITEITCHGKGAKFLCHNVKTVIDIGGQDSKAIKLDRDGNLVDFLMNDKCSAGTGRFLEVIVNTLDADMNLIDSLVKGAKPHPISSMCTVFAESEVISLIAKEIPREEILSGILSSIAKRTSSFVSKLRIEDEVFFTGGLSKSLEFKKRLEEFLNIEIKVSPLSQYAGAIGAAVIGFTKNKSSQS
jgi:predicted CoA-substrate-specific enzyme activase